ncbi:5'-methylthioadenosine/S-adenosylhomocysteine nucleosidase family protein [Celeribacter sp. ULVN23_4]
MKILITEDDNSKLKQLVGFLKTEGVPEGDIKIARNLAEFGSKLTEEIDICIIDIRIPAYEGAEPHLNGLGILQQLAGSSGGHVKSLAISAYPEEFENIRQRFESQGCILASYHEPATWQGALKVLLLQSAAREKFDFLIFTALREERVPYATLLEGEGGISTRGGVTRFDVEIEGKRGAVIELPKMGLVDAAVTAGKCIQSYSPKLVAMSGICGGFSGNALMGQLLVADPVYEYQSGKWTGDGFKAEPYQIPIQEKLRAVIWGLIESEDILASLEDGWQKNRPSCPAVPKMAPFTSGSAVIANKEFMENVSQYHRKVAGLDMEAYAIYRSAHLSGSGTAVFAAKVVVDLADAKKDDSLHEYGSHISAKFVTKVIREFFGDRNK